MKPTVTVRAPYAVYSFSIVNAMNRDGERDETTQATPVNQTYRCTQQYRLSCGDMESKHTKPIIRIHSVE